MNSSVLNLKHITKALASGMVQVRLELSKALSGIYIIGSPNPKDYGDLIYTGDIKTRIPQAYKESLDKLGFMFGVKRRFFESDKSYRSRILFAIRLSTTKVGLISTIKFTLENAEIFNKSEFDVEIRESFEDYFDGYTTAINSPVRGSSLVGGIVIYITPVTLVSYILNGKEIRTTLDNFKTTFKGKPYPPFYKFARNIDYNRLLESGEFKSMKEMLETIVAAGINIDRVILQQPGASGNKGEYYAYKL